MPERLSFVPEQAASGSTYQVQGAQGYRAGAAFFPEGKEEVCPTLLFLVFKTLKKLILIYR